MYLYIYLGNVGIKLIYISFACILNGNFYFRNVLCVKMPDSVVQESASAVMLACVELTFM